MGEGLQQDDVALGEVSQVSNEPAREVGELALVAGRAVVVEVGLVDEHRRPSQVPGHLVMVLTG